MGDERRACIFLVFLFLFLLCFISLFRTRYLRLPQLLQGGTYLFVFYVSLIPLSLSFGFCRSLRVTINLSTYLDIWRVYDVPVISSTIILGMVFHCLLSLLQFNVESLPGMYVVVLLPCTEIVCLYSRMQRRHYAIKKYQYTRNFRKK